VIFCLPSWDVSESLLGLSAVFSQFLQSLYGVSSLFNVSISPWSVFLVSAVCFLLSVFSQSLFSGLLRLFLGYTVFPLFLPRFFHGLCSLSLISAVFVPIFLLFLDMHINVFTMAHKKKALLRSVTLECNRHPGETLKKKEI
jgi:hypothetical protein